MLYIFLSDIITIFHVLLHKDYKKRFPKRLSLRLYTFFFASLLCTLYSCLSLLIPYILVSNIFVVWEFSWIFCMWFYLALRTPFGKTTFTAAGVESPRPTSLPHSVLVWFANSSGRTKRTIERKLDEGKTGNFIYIHEYNANRMKEGRDEMKWNVNEKGKNFWKLQSSQAKF